jgi:serine/threonine-protein kinase
VDRDGREEALAAEPRAYAYPRISPDGGRLALDVRDQENDIWIWDFTRETLTRLTFAPGRDAYPAWTPAGTHVAFSSERDDGTMNLHWKAADGAGAVELLNESEHRYGRRPYAFTPDGTQLVFVEYGAQDTDLGLLSLDGSPEPLLATEFSERNGEISPDGRWLAYESDASGRYEIYVRPFPNVEDGLWPISSGGGTRPRWAPDGLELFYFAPGARLMVVGVANEPSFAPGKADELFGGYFAPLAIEIGRTYDIAPDGERFLMIKESAGGDSTEFILVQNWFEELKARVPTGN